MNNGAMWRAGRPSPRTRDARSARRIQMMGIAPRPKVNSGTLIRVEFRSLADAEHISDHLRLVR